MKLAFIALDNLSVSKTNMRYARKAPDVSDILPTVRARGVIQPILVRPNCQAGHYEIVAGCRRFHAARIVAGERAEASTETRAGHDIAGAGASVSVAASAAALSASDDPDCVVAQIPCAILDDGDDADAVEASLIENCARLEPDEVSRWEAFIRLVREGRKPADIAATFGLPDLAVKRILALGNLLPRIRELYRREEIDAATVRHLTMASKSQQKAWLALIDDPEGWAPTGYRLKGWLFSGQSIPLRHALFDAEASGLACVADLFGEDSYFLDADAFWTLQNREVEERCAAYIEQGWSDAVTVPPDTHFHAWEYVKTPKRKGGRVYLDVSASGEVVIHEGYLSAREAARQAKAASSGVNTGNGEDGPAGSIPRPEITNPTRTYIDLHRHAALRAAMLERPGAALRLMAAHAIAGSPLWRVSCEPQTARGDATRESVEQSRAEAVFDERRRSVLALLGFDAEEPSVTGGNAGQGLCAVFRRLLALPDPDVLDIIAIVMGETLAAGSPAVEAAGLELGFSMAAWWQPDDAFFETLRDREVLLAMLAEVAGPDIASANAGEKTRTLKTIIRDHLDGANGRVRPEGWVPRWMAFPPSAYTQRGGVGTVDAHARAMAAPDDAGPV